MIEVRPRASGRSIVEAQISPFARQHRRIHDQQRVTIAGSNIVVSPTGVQRQPYRNSVGRALTAFLNDNCSEALKIRDQINGADGDYYGIWYMRGARQLRTEKPDLARQAFATGAETHIRGKSGADDVECATGV
jgi:hypothetical protein